DPQYVLPAVAAVPEPAGARRRAHGAREHPAAPGRAGRRRTARAHRAVRGHRGARPAARAPGRGVSPAARGGAPAARFRFPGYPVLVMNPTDSSQRQAQAVVRPRRTEEVAQCLALCQQAGVPVVPRGGNTGMCGGATPDAGPANVVLSLDRMNAVRSIDTIANTMVAEAGCILGNLRRAADEAGRLLPLSLAAEDSCQIGGNVSTNAGGVNVVRYGMTRELVLGLEAVLPTGEVFNGLRTLRKDNTGYDLKQLLIGAEGTLGVITAVALRLFPRTGVRSVVLAAVQSPAQALQLFELVYEQCGPRLQAYEFFTGECVDLVLAHAQ